MSKYLGEFSCKEDVARNFEIELDDSVEILFAAYEYICYEGQAFVLFKKDGKLQEVNGSHCSCRGLEGQWEPEYTTIAALTRRAEKGNLYGAELLEVLEGLK